MHKVNSILLHKVRGGLHPWKMQKILLLTLPDVFNTSIIIIICPFEVGIKEVSYKNNNTAWLIKYLSIRADYIYFYYFI